MGWQRKSPPQPFGRFGGRRRWPVAGSKRSSPAARCGRTGAGAGASAAGGFAFTVHLRKLYAAGRELSTADLGRYFQEGVGQAGLSHIDFGELGPDADEKAIVPTRPFQPTTHRTPARFQPGPIQRRLRSADSSGFVRSRPRPAAGWQSLCLLRTGPVSGAFPVKWGGSYDLWKGGAITIEERIPPEP